MQPKANLPFVRFFGFKLHPIINDRSGIIEFLITQAGVDDREPLKDRRFHGKVFGKLFADRGYISQDLFEMLFIDGVHLITGLKKNMKNSLMLTGDRIMLRKRAITETVNAQLKTSAE